jgi:Fic family protein
MLKAGHSALLVFECFKKKPLLTISALVKLTQLSKPTIAKTIEHLVKFGIIKPVFDFLELLQFILDF